MDFRVVCQTPANRQEGVSESLLSGHQVDTVMVCEHGMVHCSGQAGHGKQFSGVQDPMLGVGCPGGLPVAKGRSQTVA